MIENRNPPKARATPLDKLIGENVAIRRKAMGLSQEDFCEKWGFSEPLLSLLENGKKPWNSTTLSAALDVLETTLAELAGGVILSPEDQRDLELLRAHRQASLALQELKAPPKK